MLRRLAHISTVVLLSSCVVDAGESTPSSSGDDPRGSGGLLGPTNAFVLAHGFGGNREMGFGDAVADELTARGHQVFKAEVPSTDSVAIRAAALALEVDGFMASSGAEQVHVIAHSMGGLDSRYLISTLGYADKIKSLTTISTPHRGTPLADQSLGLLEGNAQTQDAATDGLLALLEGTPLDPAAFQRGVTDLAEANAPVFNAANVDDPNVVYISYAGLSTFGGTENANAAAVCEVPGAATPAPDSLRPLLFLPAPIVTGVDGRPNDGVVPVDSAIWGDFRGCIPADHIDENGALGSGNSGIDAPQFYADLADELATLP